LLGDVLKSWIRLSILGLVGAVLTLSFTNCGRIAPSGVMSASSLGGDICSKRLKLVYQNTYFPFLSSSCNSCHGSAHGSSDLSVSFNSFLSKSVAVIDYKAITAHGGNSLSAAVNQPILDSFKSAYSSAYSEYSSCKARLANGDVFDMTLDYKSVPTLEIPTNTNAQWKVVTWDTEADATNAGSSSKFRALVSIDIRAYTYLGSIVGVQFRNPRLTLKAGQAPMSIQGVKLSMNGQALGAVTAYTSLNMNLQGTTEIQLAAGLGSPAIEINVAGSNTLSMDLIGLSANLTDNTGGDTTPIIDGGDLTNLPTSMTLALRRIRPT